MPPDACELQAGRTRPTHRAVQEEDEDAAEEGGGTRVARWQGKKEKEAAKGAEGGMALSVDTRGSLLFRETHHPLTLDRGQRKELVNVNLLMASAPGPF